MATNWRLAHGQISVGYTWFFAGLAAFTPYAAIYYRGLGFAGWQVGLLTSMPAIGLMISSALWGIIADAYGAHRLILRSALAVSAFLALAAAQFDHFWMLLVWITLLSFTTVPLRSLLDHYAVTVGEHVGRSFGRIRLWGAFGYSAFAVSLGRIMSKEVTATFLIAYSIALALTLAAVWGLPKLDKRTPERFREGLADVLQSRDFRLLLMMSIAQSILHFAIVTALGVHIISNGGTNTQVGAAFAIAAISELPFFVAGAKLVQRFGPIRLIILVGLAYVVRLVLLGTFTAPGASLTFQALHGLTFGIFLVTAVPFTRRVAGKNYPATAQAVFTMATFGIGSVGGSMIAALLMDVMPTPKIFLILGLGMAVVTALYAALQRRNASAQTSFG